MTDFNTKIEGRVVTISRIGAIGPPGKEFPEFIVNTTEAGMNIIDTIPMTDVRSSVYLIHLVSSVGSQFGELHLIHDDFSVYITQTGETIIDQPVGSFYADIINNNIELYCDVVDAETTIRFKKMTLTNDISTYAPIDGDLMLLDITFDLQTSSCPDEDLMI